MNAQTDLWTVLVILGLALITVLTRTLFFLSSKPWHLPHWAQRGCNTRRLLHCLR